jgi:hypothetical protein
MKGPRNTRKSILGGVLRFVNATEIGGNPKPVRERRFFAFLEIGFGVSKK